MISHYIVRVIDNDLEKYLFSRYALVGDPALAKRFTNISAARRYFQLSAFCALRYIIIVVRRSPLPPPRHNLGSIVE